jgi:hypothetical protein
MISNDEVKEAIVTNLKAYATLVARLADGQQGIRERGWRGDVFQYPCVRVDLESQRDLTPESNCTPVTQEWSIYVYSEEHSSREADQIAGLIANHFQGLFFSDNNIKFTRVNILESIPALPEDERTWRAQVRCRSILYPA